MNPAMYVFANRGVGMSPGKLGAQTAHAAVEAFRLSEPRMIDEWYKGGHYKKLVMLAEDGFQLLVFEKYIMERGFQTHLVIDEGRTEIDAFTPTALGVEIVDKDDDHTKATFESFRSYKERKPVQPKKRKAWLFR